MKLYQNATRIDLNSGVHFLATPTQGAANERRTNDLFATHGLSATRRFSSMRATLQRQSQNQNFLLSRSVSLHGLRPVNPPRIPSRYRSLSANIRAKTLSRRVSLQANFPQHIGQRQPSQALENLCRLRPNPHRHSHRTLRRYRLGLRSGQHHLRLGFNDHRPVSLAVSMGNFSPNQVGCQNAHAAESQRLDTRIYPYFRGVSARCEHSRRPADSAIGHLFTRPRLPGFWPAFHGASSRRFLCHTHQIQHSLSKNLLVPRRQIDRAGVRPDDSIDKFLCSQRLSRSIASSEIQRSRDGQAIGVFDQLVQRPGPDDCDVVSSSLAGGVIFQMDQTTSANQAILRHHSQRRQDTNLDCRERLRPRCDCQKADGSRTEPLHIATDSKPRPVRENAYFTGLFANRVRYSKPRKR